jgi:phosphate-selective porin OprO/OprP
VAAATVDTTLEAGEADAVPPKRQFLKWNQYDGPVSTLRYGINFMYDFSNYAQDDDSKQQFDLSPDNGLRDFRIVFSGKFKTKRAITWTLGYMYDGADDEWRFRQTGFQVDLPEISGRVFLGRTKEGYSLIKVTNGALIWGMERSQTLDAFVPILADGIKYMGYYPRQRVLLNVGLFSDVLSEKEKFSTYDNQLVTRIAWQPVLSEENRTVAHIAFMARRTKPDEDKLREKARPGDYQAPFFLDTGTFPADRSQTYGLEALYRRGSVLFWGEYDWQKDHATSGEEPMFHGGNVSVIWLVTGETRPYNAAGGFIEAVSPKRTVFEGGPGAIEAGLDLSFNDFNDGSFQGGKFWRLTPLVGWHLADYLRWTVVYGVGVLDRFGVKGTTQFFQTRFQLLL